MRRFPATLLLMGALALAGCDPVADQAPSAPDTPASSTSAGAVPSQPAPSDGAMPSAVPTAAADGTSVTGTLAGDNQLEGGCAWVETVDGRIEPVLPDGYTLSTSPVAIIGPDGTPVAEDGEQVTLIGSPAPDMMSTCQVGAVWRITAVKVASGG